MAPAQNNRLQKWLNNGWVQLGLFVFVIVHFTTLYFVFIAPQRKANEKEGLMKSWAWAGEVLLSVAEECKKNPEDKLCARADDKAYSFVRSCREQITEAINSEGLEAERETYQEKKAFVLDLCKLLEQSEYAKEPEAPQKDDDPK